VATILQRTLVSRAPPVAASTIVHISHVEMLSPSHIVIEEIMKLKLRLFVFTLSIAFSSILAAGQLTVDTTGPIRQRLREPDIGRGGGSGRRVPIQVAIGSTGAPTDENGKTVFEFMLTNSGKADLEIPICPHPRDLEPVDAKAIYSVKVLGLYVTSNKGQTNILPGQAHLYGNDATPGTLMRLTPGQSVRVIVRVAIPPRTLGSQPGEGVLVGHVRMGEETIQNVNNQIRGDTREIGSASSSEYPLDAVTKLHN